jgi:hypothetical protein
LHSSHIDAFEERRRSVFLLAVAGWGTNPRLLLPRSGLCRSVSGKRLQTEAILDFPRSGHKSPLDLGIPTAAANVSARKRLGFLFADDAFQGF